MANPVCLSPLKFYDSPSKQEFRKTYAYGHISPLIIKNNILLPFQFVIPSSAQLGHAYLHKPDESYMSADIAQSLSELGFTIKTVDSYNIAVYPGTLPLLALNAEGQYYLELVASDNSWHYYSEIFCCTHNVDDCLEIEYWNKADNFYIKDGLVTFADGFKFKLYIKSELGKPEYSFEEEVTKRLGYSFVESQVSKKIYKFNAIVPEFLCDAMRVIRLCSDKTLTSKGDTYSMLTYNMSVEWQTQGDLASVSSEFEVDNIIVNIGDFTSANMGGDFRNTHFNDDFDNQ
jgi:hypothetical protein